ncbi:hypothetical protein BDDG_13163 [Blastomyces dermatitidis ATCC 18188]|uniref:Uncharacterized protein n=1 Tax=Ajellomyces dermatitidis (strain ATCC 18188 / CBS 674.68) TaxID=653446 RepID=A0A0J9ES96_AJEDA|nr:hypothetical protein BDDG_13163 [Blastomyces dermatitidis ATCC 18188]
MITSSSPSALSLHSIFRSAAHLIPLSDQSLTSSSAVPFFVLSVLPVSPAALQVYNHSFSAHTISDQAYVNMSRFPTNGPRAAAHFHNLIVNERWVPGYPQNPGNQGNANAMNSQQELA